MAGFCGVKHSLTIGPTRPGGSSYHPYTFFKTHGIVHLKFAHFIESKLCYKSKMGGKNPKMIIRKVPGGLSSVLPEDPEGPGRGRLQIGKPGTRRTRNESSGRVRLAREAGQRPRTPTPLARGRQLRFRFPIRSWGSPAAAPPLSAGSASAA